MVKNLPANAGHTVSIPGLVRSTCGRATKPCTTTTEPGLYEPQALKPACPRARALQQEKSLQ